MRVLFRLASIPTLSRVVGWVAARRVSRVANGWFTRHFQVRLDEADRPLSEYTSLQDLFTRRLRPGVRPVDPGPEAVVSPVDARVNAFGAIEGGCEFQVKGARYTVGALLDDEPGGARYAGGRFVVLYLAPPDYHRIHAPLDGEVVGDRHIPGGTFPVNDAGHRYFPPVLARNERRITTLRHGGGEVAVVKVAATNVADIRLVERANPSRLEKGEEFALFALGSTVVLLFTPGCVELDPTMTLEQRYRVGERIATLSSFSEEDLP